MGVLTLVSPYEQMIYLPYARGSNIVSLQVGGPLASPK